MHIKNHWWSVHPERGLIFYSNQRRPCLENASPQCNSSEGTAKYLQEKLYPWAQLRYFETVLYPIEIKDYT